MLFNPDDINTYTVKQMRQLNSHFKLGIGSTSKMSKRDLIENIKETNWWQLGHNNLDELFGGTNEQPTTPSIKPEIKPEVIELKPIVEELKSKPVLRVEPPRIKTPPRVEPTLEPKPIQRVEPSFNIPLASSDKVTTTISKDASGSTIIVIHIKP